MIRRQALSKAIDKAAHESWCGSPPSCLSKDGERCAGRLSPKELQAVVDTAYAALVHERATQPLVVGYVWCYAHTSVHTADPVDIDNDLIDAQCGPSNWERIRMAGDNMPRWQR